jgi:hypothetical protein
MYDDLLYLILSFFLDTTLIFRTKTSFLKILLVSKKFFLFSEIYCKKKISNVKLNNKNYFICFDPVGNITKKKTYTSIYFHSKKSKCFNCDKKTDYKVHLVPRSNENWIICRTCEIFLPDYQYLPLGTIERFYGLALSDCQNLRLDQNLRYFGRNYNHDSMWFLKNEIIELKKMHRISMNGVLYKDGYFHVEEYTTDTNYDTDTQIIGFKCPFCFERYYANSLNRYKNSPNQIHWNWIDKGETKITRICNRIETKFLITKKKPM